MTPMFSVIMPSYLGSYNGAASGREEKFIRAVESVIDQTFKDWELIVVADGCERTLDLLNEHIGDRRVRPFLIEKTELWCPGPRNTGIHHARGKWIAYLDTDDLLGPDHLSSIAAKLTDQMQWAYFDALWWNKKAGSFQPKPVEINRCSHHGTANIVHRNNGYLWPTQRRNRDGKLDYGTQDCAFVDVLKKQPGQKIHAGEYHVCHIPSRVAGAYEV